MINNILTLHYMKLTLRWSKFNLLVGININQ